MPKIMDRYCGKCSALGIYPFFHCDKYGISLSYRSDMDKVKKCQACLKASGEGE